MTLHPDVLTDLVILYHAGEASQASRELLEKEALHNPAIAAALAARPRIIQPVPAEPMNYEREVLNLVRTSRPQLRRDRRSIGNISCRRLETCK